MCSRCDRLGRRRLFAGSAALATTAFLAHAAVAQPTSAASTPEEALRLLMDGNARYVANNVRTGATTTPRNTLMLGQAPFASILGCSDSRIAPEQAFDRGPGELFVVRVAGNFVTPDGLGSLEYGVAVLKTKLIMVLGHTSCGAVTATMAALRSGNTLPGHINNLVRAMKPGLFPALQPTDEDQAIRTVRMNVAYQVHRLQTATPILSKLVAKKELRVVGGVYDLATGEVTLV